MVILKSGGTPLLNLLLPEESLVWIVKLHVLVAIHSSSPSPNETDLADVFQGTMDNEKGL